MSFNHQNIEPLRKVYYNENNWISKIEVFEGDVSDGFNVN